uniref:Poly [ADP-ribose] polymerase n=1 Tax=Myotis lucifugus TaxID=59463 RepID=G1PAB3_MYOLU
TPKRKPPAQCEGPDKKKGRQGTEEDNFRSTAEALKAAPTEKRTVRVDPSCPLSHKPGAQVHEDYDCTLNQTNIGNNNNKFYIIQLLEDGGRFACWNRWGRVGEVGQSKLSYFPSLEDAKKDFEKKFKDKTKNSWAEREHFVAQPGKYTLIEVQGEEEAQEAVVKVKWPPGKLLRCQLQLLDPEAPEYKVGWASRSSRANRGTVPLPTGHGPLPLAFLPMSLEALRAPPLGDQSGFTRTSGPWHPTPALPQVIHTYLKQTGGSYRSPVLRHAWKVNRDGEGDRFQAHSTLGNRRLLWHGTNVAVVAAILTSGLRIMPHSGGRVGKGIYFASENSKSACYVTTMSCGAHHIAYMFLGEVALGREHHITADDNSLKQPPPGFDSVVARGHTEPDPTQDTELELDGRRVAVPQGQPKPCPEFSHSSFSQSEYLIYQESQCRLRYLLEVGL